MLKVAVISMNALLVIGFLYTFVDDVVNFYDPWAWLFFGLWIACPVLNVLGLLQFRRRTLTILATIYNGITICFWAYFLHSMMGLVWARPSGVRLAIFLVFWTMLAVTEVVLIRTLIGASSGRKTRSRASQSPS